MKNEKVKNRGFLSLFDGRIKGTVLNPYTGTVMARREVLELYRYLALKRIDEPGDEWTYEMLDLTRELLAIPEDLHLAIIKELKTAGKSETHWKRPIMEEVEAIRFFRKGFCRGGEERHMERTESARSIPGNRVFGGDILDLETGSLLFEMEQDSIDMGDDSTLSKDYMIEVRDGIFDSMIGSSKKRPQKL